MPNIYELPPQVNQLEKFEQIVSSKDIHSRFVGKQKQCIEATSHLFLHFNPYLNKHTLIEIN